MKRRTGRWFGKESGDQTANNGAANAEQAREDEAKVLGTWHNLRSNPTDDETDDNGPNDM